MQCNAMQDSKCRNDLPEICQNSGKSQADKIIAPACISAVSSDNVEEERGVLAEWGAVHTKRNGLIFATAGERNFPELLCRRMAQLVAMQFNVKPLLQSDQEFRVAAARQLR